MDNNKKYIVAALSMLLIISGLTYIITRGDTTIGGLVITVGIIGLVLATFSEDR